MKQKIFKVGDEVKFKDKNSIRKVLGVGRDNYLNKVGKIYSLHYLSNGLHYNVEYPPLNDDDDSVVYLIFYEYVISANKSQNSRDSHHQLTDIFLPDPIIKTTNENESQKVDIPKETVTLKYTNVRDFFTYNY